MPISRLESSSVAKNTGCSSRGPEFNSNQPHGGSQPSSLVPDALFWCAGVHADRTHIHNLKNKMSAATTKHQRGKAIYNNKKESHSKVA